MEICDFFVTLRDFFEYSFKIPKHYGASLISGSPNGLSKWRCMFWVNFQIYWYIDVAFFFLFFFALLTAATSYMQLFVIIFNGWKLLIIVTKSCILDVAWVLDPPLSFLGYLFDSSKKRSDPGHFLKSQGKFFWSFLCTLFYIFLTPKNYKSRL